jgi:hypothetical protein
MEHLYLRMAQLYPIGHEYRGVKAKTKARLDVRI